MTKSKSQEHPATIKIAEMTRAEILRAARELPPDERRSIAREIAQTADDEAPDLPEAEWDAMWADEAERRLLEIEEGKVKDIPGEEVMARARAILRS